MVANYSAIKDVHSGERDPTFFEFTTAMALVEFADQKVDWAIIETGMGGRLDATNIIHPALSIITNISLEHREYLGNTLDPNSQGKMLESLKPAPPGSPVYVKKRPLPR